jgi:tetratricopeptide (TPR) repeat protein
VKRTNGWLLCLVVLSFGGAYLNVVGSPDPSTLIEQAEESFDRWNTPFDFVGYRDRLETAIGLWEQSLPEIPADQTQTKTRVLNRLSQAYFELAEGYLSIGGDREAAYEKGKDAALESLRLDPVFVATNEEHGFRAALHAATDVAAIFWYGNTLGQWLDFHWWTAVVEGGVRDVYASFQRSIELDETYDGGGPHRAMAAFLAQACFLVGRSREDAVLHFERSIEMDPTYLENHVNYAEYYARATKNWDLLDTLLTDVAAKADDPAIVGAWPFYNYLAIERADALRDARP